MSAIGAGAGAAATTSSSNTTTSSTVTERKFRSPTNEEAEQIQELLKGFLLVEFLSIERLFDYNFTEDISETLKEIEKFLNEHPDVNVNQVYSNSKMKKNIYGLKNVISERDMLYLDAPRFTNNLNLYGMLMLSPLIDINNPVLQEIIRRKPHPKVVYHTNNSANNSDWYYRIYDRIIKLDDLLKKEIQMIESDLLEFKNQNRPQEEIDKAESDAEKVLNILKNKLKYVQNIEKVKEQGKIISGIMRSGLQQKIPENAIGVIGSYLIGKKGTPRIQMNQLRQNVGLSSLITKQNTKKGGKSNRKKSYKRKNLRRKTKKLRK